MIVKLFEYFGASSKIGTGIEGSYQDWARGVPNILDNSSIGLHLLGMRYLVKARIQRGGEAENLGLRPSLQWEQAFVR